MCSLIGRPDLAEDARFATASGRRAYQDELDAAIAEVEAAFDFLDGDGAAVMRAFQSGRGVIVSEPYAFHRRLGVGSPTPSRTHSIVDSGWGTPSP